MKLFKKLFTPLAIIVLLAAFLRLWSLSTNPPHLTPDEASLGYNAYSILKTGRDEYGEFMPIVFKSFGDYKPGLYVYTTVPFVGILGLNELSVRLPSALAGISAVYVLFKILMEVSNKKVALFGSFFLAINPWHIHFSRGAWEVNLSLTLALLGILFFLKALKKEKYLLLSAVFFSLTLLAYQGAKLSTAIILLVLLVVYWKECFKFKKGSVVKATLLGLLVSTPIIFSLFQGKAGRLTVFSLFSYPRPVEYTQIMLDQNGEEFGDLNYLTYHGEPYNFVRGISGRWFNHFSGKFLFFEGDSSNPRHSVPYHGVFTAADLILMLFGIIYLLRFDKKLFGLVFLWVVLAPLPSALSRDQVHAIRAYNLLIPLTIVVSMGAYYLLDLLKGKKYLLSAFLLVYFASYVYFLDSYFVHQPKQNSQLWEYGYKQIVETITPIQGNYEKIKVQQSFAQPYIYFLFHQAYDPAKYQENSKLVSSGFKHDVGYVERIDNVEFVPIDWSVVRGDSGTLFVGDPVRIPPTDSADEELFTVIREIKYLNGIQTAFRIVEVK